MQKVKAWLPAVVVAVLALTLCTSPFVLTFSPFVSSLINSEAYRNQQRSRESKFDSQRWKSANWVTVHRGEDNVRDLMVNDLLTRYDFRDWNRNSVIALLGKPDNEQEDWRDNRTFSWYRLDGALDYLLVQYDQDWKVVETIVSHD